MVQCGRRKQIFLLVLGLAFVLASPVVDAATQSGANAQKQLNQLQGRLTIDDPSFSWVKVNLSINGVHIPISTDGSFMGPVPDSDLYELRISGETVFASVQTFAHAELHQDDVDKYSIPAISVVSKRPGRVELVFGGDVMMGRRYENPRWNEPVLVRPNSILEDMTRLTTSMKPYFETSDFASVNLETVLATDDPGEYAPKSIVFYTHSDAAQALESMGLDYVTLGNNHIYDYLDSGVRSTVAALDAAGLTYSGGGLDEAQALAPYRTQISGQNYGFIGFVGWKGRVQPDQVAAPGKGGAAYGSRENISSAIELTDDGDRVVVAQYHGSREYSEEPTPITEGRLKAAIDAGADLVIGHHPHVSQGLELHNGKLIAWSLGNFIFDQFFYETHGSFALKVWMDGDRFYRAEIIPVHVRNYKPQPAVGWVREYVLQRLTQLSADRGTIVSRSGGHGVIERETKGSQLSSGSRTEISPGPSDQQGNDLFFRGDFESYALDRKRDRSWQVENGSLHWDRAARSGRYALSLKPIDTSSPMQLGFKTFFRVLKKENMRFEAWVKPTGDMKVKAFAQYRPKGMDRYKALAESPLTPIGTSKIEVGDWQKIAFNFKNRRAGEGERPLPVRVMLEIESTGVGQSGHLLIDDLKLLELGNRERAHLPES